MTSDEAYAVMRLLRAITEDREPIRTTLGDLAAADAERARRRKVLDWNIGAVTAMLGEGC